MVTNTRRKEIKHFTDFFIQYIGIAIGFIISFLATLFFHKDVISRLSAVRKGCYTVTEGTVVSKNIEKKEVYIHSVNLYCAVVKSESETTYRINNLNKEQFNSIEYGRKVFIVKPDSDSDSKELYLTL